MPSSTTWVGRVPEFGDAEGEQPDASHMEEGRGVPLPLYEDDPATEWYPSGLSSSGVESTPEVGSLGPTDGVDQTPGAASSASGVGSAPPELQKKLIFDESSGRFVSKTRLEQRWLAQEFRQVSGQQHAVVEALGLRCTLLTGDLEKLQEEMKK